MNRRTGGGLICICITSALVAGCESADEALVAQVGPYRITAGQYRSYVESLPGRWQPDMTGDEARLHHLQVLIDRCLLLTEARTLGLDTLATAREAAARAVDEYVVARYRLDWIRNQPELTEEEIKHVFHGEGFGRERRGLVIRVRTRAEIDTVLTELRSEQPFLEVARLRSLDRTTLEMDGGPGFLDRDQAARLGIPVSLFASLPLNQTSSPLRTGTDWQVVRFVEERPADYDRYRETIRTELKNRRRAELDRLPRGEQQAAAREAGFYEGPDFLRAERKAREEAMLEMLRRRTNRAIDISPEQTRRYYDTHQEVFRHEEALWIEEVLLASATEAIRVRQEIEAGARFADLAVRSLRDRTRQQHGRLHFHAEDLVRFARLMPAAKGTEVGLLSGPLQVEGGFSVFRVLGRTADRVDPFDAVQDRARSLLLQQHQQERLSSLLDRLRTEHSTVIEIHTSRLQGAVPDYLLGG
ncbi:MAG TPA: peptidyl-prolyl cis-trans isomerase [Candidatus Latescibacteria bacterium]|nr:peptidyl-prolyl cis-trans isomerase [Candidatus Latescibacterota bacterium]HJP33021.1 peptidyl-prolyl cis-trans isomerase [Candidatus Latescibacterota bacterium]